MKPTIHISRVPLTIKRAPLPQWVPGAYVKRALPKKGNTPKTIKKKIS